MNGTFVLLPRLIRLAWRGARRGPLVCGAVVLSALAALFLLQQLPQRRHIAAASRKMVPIALSTLAARNATQRLANLGWAFEPNVGQSVSEVKFLARASGATVFLTDDSVYVSWNRAAHDGRGRAATKGNSLRLEFAGAGRSTRRAGDTLLSGKTNYLLGRNAQQWHTNVPHYAAVQYAGLYPGVDARFYGGAQGLEYDLTAARGSDLRQILLRVRGADALYLDPQGNLVIRIGARQLIMKRPYMYQLDGGAHKSVTGGYRLLSSNEVGFDVGKYRADLPLIIDPSISIAYTTFLGGAGAEKGNSVAVDSSGDIYVGGTTTIPNFPGDSTTFTYGSASGSSSMFVAKIDPTQSGAASLIYLTFIGGSGSDQGGIVAADNSVSPSRVAILGWTTSQDFPVTVTGSTLSGPSDLTVTELRRDGNTVLFSEYFGGSGTEAAQNAGGIATDSSGDVFVTSDTTSANLPVTPTAIQSTFVGPSDGLLSEFRSDGTLIYCTYLGINAQTVGSTGVAVDSSGNAYVAGFTSTTTTSFANGFQETYPGGSLDGFVMEINPSPFPPSLGLIYGSFIGGTGSDQAFAIAVDTATPADAYVTGVTQSTDLIPSTGVTNPPFQSTLNGTSNGFLAVISQSSGTPALQYITYLGGNGTDVAQGVAVFSSTQVFVAGSTTSANFPNLCSLQGFSGTQDAFLAQFNPSVGGTSSLLGTTFLGGSFTAEANAVGAGPSGNAIIFGDTISPDYPLAGNPQTGFQPICASCAATPPLSDALLTKVNMSATAQACVAFNPAVATFGSFADGTSAPPVSVLLTNDGGASLNVSSVTVTGTNSTDFSVGNDTCVTNSPIAPAGTCNFSITFTPSIIGPETAQLQVTDDGIGSPQSLTLNGTGAGVGIMLSPTSLTFPGTAQGQVDPNAMMALLTNTSSDNLTIQSSIQGTNATDFKFGTSNTCTSIITPGGTCTIAIQFAPNEPNPPQTLSAQDVLTVVDATNSSTQTVTVALSGTEIAAAPGIVFSPASLAFSGENVGGTTAPQPTTVTNDGSAPLIISSVSITGANQGDFSETNTCVALSPLAPSANCTISVTFKPAATGPRAADVSVADNASGSPQTVPLTGTGTAVGVTLTPSSLTFAGQNPGTPASPPQTVTLQNTGTGPLTISGIAITGTNAGDFAQTNNCPIGPAATLRAGAACSIAVTFAPTGTGPRSASLSVSDSAIPSPQIVSLSGIGTVPGAQFSLPTIQFGTVIVGAQSGKQAVQLNNTGNGSLVITQVGFVGANPGDFQASGSCVGANGASVSVAAGSNCAVIVVFAPTAAGARSATLSVTDNASSSPQQLPVTGTATNFQLSAVSGGSTSTTMTAGETATFSLQVTPANGFTGTVTMSSADPIPASMSTISTTQVVVSGGQPAGFTVTVTTTAPNATASRGPFFPRPMSGHLRIVMGLWLLAFALLTLWKWKSRSQRPFRPALLLVGVLLLASCGGGGGSSSPTGTPAGTYTVTITGTISGITRNLNLSITVQ